MSKSNGSETYDDDVVVVSKVTELPYAHIPYSSVAAARAKHPDSKLYVYEGKAPAGYKIVAFPILMTKPEEGSDGE
jgi:hypothetical protein